MQASGRSQDVNGYGKRDRNWLAKLKPITDGL
jgi:hypothetical protein